MIERYESGETQREIAASFGVHRKTVGAALARHGIKRESVLTPQQVDIAVACYARGSSLNRIGTDLQVSPNTVRRALVRRGAEIRR